MNYIDNITIDTPAHRRADELVNAAGALESMREAAEANGELVLAEYLRRAQDAALMRLAAVDADLAAGWREVHQGNVIDRQMIGQELRGLASSRFFTRGVQSLFGRAATLVDATAT